MAVSNQVNQNEGIAGDRRNDRRYQIALDLRWKLIRRRKVLNSGDGQTIDLSSGGILFDSRRPLPAGLDVELSVAWPFLLNNTAPLQLFVQGRIVRSEGNLTAIRMVQHEFRTMGASGEHGRGVVPSGKVPVLVMSNRGTSRYDILH